MGKYKDYMQVKHQKKLAAREHNREQHAQSVRHAWNPQTQTELDLIFQEILNSFNCEAEKFKATNFTDKNKLIKILRENTQLKYSANKLRMFYHMRASGTDASYINGYKSCMRLLETWEKIYGKPWEGEPFHIDHIVPLSKASSIKELRKLNRLDNLCMLSPTHNQSKGNRFPHPIILKLKGNN